MKILIADDDPLCLVLLKRTLAQWGYEVIACAEGQVALEHLQEGSIHLAILDWEMPGINGVEICKRIRALHQGHIYLVLLSARDRKQDVISGLEAGADDFIRKPFDAEELRARLQTGRRVIALEQSLKELAIRDSLTGLYNRRYMEDTFERELLRASRYRTEIGIILADIDHFKKLNDTFGHQTGDFALRNVARVLLGHVRGCDVVCRYGGEEFLLILPQASVEVTVTRAEQLRKLVADLGINSDQGIPALTISMGVAVFPIHGSGTQELILAADKALYQAKQNGRNRVVFARSAIASELAEAFGSESPWEDSQ